MKRWCCLAESHVIDDQEVVARKLSKEGCTSTAAKDCASNEDKECGCAAYLPYRSRPTPATADGPWSTVTSSVAVAEACEHCRPVLLTTNLPRTVCFPLHTLRPYPAISVLGSRLATLVPAAYCLLPPEPSTTQPPRIGPPRRST